MRLSQLLGAINVKDPQNDTDITDIVYDSRKVTKGCAFVCMRGSAVDGHNFAKKAEELGASVIIAEENVEVSIPVVIVKDTREALAVLSAEFFGNPAQNDIKVIGITGTKGKTTTAAMIRSILEKNGDKTGIIGTIGVGIGDELIKTNNTTPASYEVQKYLRKMADEGCKYCVMEASSIGLRDLRIFGFEFEIALFTNFSEDHIGGVEHQDMEEYLECKSMLFKMCKLAVANIDDENCEKVLSDANCPVVTYGFSENADYKANEYQLISRNGLLGISFNVSGKMNFVAEAAIPGKFNAYNALSAIAVCDNLGVSAEKMNEGLLAATVKGRVEPVAVDGDYTVLIDYAHNAVSMENILSTLREYKPNRLICVFGAGGNRPKLRRFEMGEVSGMLADLTVITEDNSRFEDINDIMADIKTGIEKTNGKYVMIPSRKDAIKYCLKNAQKDDIIVLAGKGHEDYQEVNGEKIHFDEREVIAKILEEMK